MLVGVVVVACLVVIAVPYLASTRIVRDGIAVEMSAWSGYRVEIAEPPVIEFWPSLRANLSGVTFSQWGTPGGEQVARVERIEVDLSPLAALRGRAEISAALLVRPRLDLSKRADGSYAPQLPRGGRIAESIRAARAALRADGRLFDGRSLPDDTFGRIEIQNGTIDAVTSTEREVVATDVSGSISWPALNQGGKLSMRGRWRDEATSIDFEAESPLILFAGGQTSVNTVLKAVSATGSFAGTVKLSEPYFDGRVSLSAPSYENLAAWTRSKLAADGAIRSATLSSSISGDLRRLKFEGLDIEIDGHHGSGAIDVSFAKGHPAISGSLAFETFDMAAMLAAVSPLAASEETPDGEAPPKPDPLDFDLRLSALRASAGTVQMSDVAATAQVRDGFAAFDISDAESFGGNLQASIRFDRKAHGPMFELRLLASDVDGGAFGSAAGMTRLVPIGRGTVSVILKGPGSGLEQMLVHASGSVSATFGQGALSQFDLNEFLRRMREGGFFSLAEVSGGSLPIQSAVFKARIADGVAYIETAEAVSGSRTLRLSGVVPYIGGALALTGTVDQTGTPPEQVDFFVGGSWSAPFVSPVLPKSSSE